MYNVQKQIAKLRSTDISDILKKENRSSALYLGKKTVCILNIENDWRNEMVYYIFALKQ